MKYNDPIHFYVACPPGLEPVLASEYHALNFTRIKYKKADEPNSRPQTEEDNGGMEFEGPLEQVYQANLFMRSASRVTVRLGEFIAISFAELRKKAAKLEWDNFLRPGQKVVVQATCHKSRLYHSDAVAERVLAAINDHFQKGQTTLETTTGVAGDQLILVRMVNDVCTISVDSSGELLHRRGYRQAVAKAPLRENLAAGILMASGWDQVSPLIDPFCGSGTIPIEAAMFARKIAPGINRDFQFTTWPVFHAAIWETLMAKAKSQILPDSPALFGYDRDTGAIESAKSNSARAGQLGIINFSAQAISYLQPSTIPGWVVTNPPYGVRVSENQDLRDLYSKFGAILKDRFTGWKICVLSSEERLLANMNLGEPIKKIRLINGGIPVIMANYKIS